MSGPASARDDRAGAAAAHEANSLSGREWRKIGASAGGIAEVTLKRVS
jgi:hypothetical protein